ncbi:extracellular solute-binding protein [Paenibacillus sacheonensis]|uniref:Extracellular solute-binding protein n=1 Tax=Paenibacillus sacheonensis TaxID=742054 RepID=A0A7X4YLH5_9BACL|nr:extracellular solute-binding protein [Paenibacillus sacheonensis]MBM7564021.1 putative aldouronate transport system substrate-binding protein [Paenibacillus sacheonensis]NBC67644.1 extracellular solute-binding protein [Paenibacillus sacheonensis]
MKEKTLRKASLSVALAMSLALTACGNSGSNGNDPDTANGDTPANANAANDGAASGSKDPFGPLPEKTTLTVLKADPDSTPKDLGLPEGDTVLKNRYVQALSDKMNIDVQFPVVVKGSAIGDKTNLMIASNDITDVMLVSYTQYQQMIKADMLEDLTQVYRDYASPALKGVLQTDGGKAMNLATVDGKLYGIPTMGTLHNSDPLVWLRKDWLDKLSLQPPKTIDELNAILKAFIEKDPDGDGKKDTIGMPGAQTFTGQWASTYGFDPVFDYYKSYVKNWIKGPDGTVQYGSIQPQTKDALKKLSEMYAEGLVPKDFPVLKNEQANELVISGKAGAFFGPWWSGWSPLNDAIKNDPTADWQAYALKDADGVARAKQETPIGTIAVLKKGFKHPEALVKVVNYEYQVTLDDPADAGGDPYAGLVLPNWQTLPIALALWRADSVILDHTGILAASKGEALPDVPEATAVNYKTMGAFWAKGIDWLRKNPDNYGEPISRIIGVNPIIENDIEPVYSEFYSTTKTMQRKMTNLNKLEEDAMIKIITGEKPVDYFDDFVSQWKKQGGDEITQEVNEALKQ